MLTIKQLTATVGYGVTPRMVRHYHQIGLMPSPKRSASNYRLYNETDVQRLRRIMALKQQGFQLSHIKQMLEQESMSAPNSLLQQLQEQYQTVLQQLVKWRQTAIALEGLLGRDNSCQSMQAEALAQLRQLQVETETTQSLREGLWDSLDAAVCDHPENFQQALQRLLPDLSQRPEIEVDILSHLVLACGDVSLVNFIRLSPDLIKVARETLSTGGTIVTDVPQILNTLDHARLAHLNCESFSLINDPHLDSAADAEQAFWQNQNWQQRLAEHIEGNIWVVGYAPSILLKLCELVETQHCQPALVIGLPIGFSHAPAAKRRLMKLPIPYLTSESALGGGLLAAVVLNRLVASLLEKPNCHCYLQSLTTSLSSETVDDKDFLFTNN